MPKKKEKLTAEQIAAATGHDIRKDERLRERHFGVFEGLTQKEMEARELDAALLVLMLPWYHLSPYLAAPVIDGAGALMQFGFHWVEGVQREGTVGTLLTTLNVMVPQGQRFTVGQLR